VYYAARCGSTYESRGQALPVSGFTTQGDHIHGWVGLNETKKIDHQRETVSIDEACEGAKASREALIRRDGSTAALRVASKRVYQMCQRGRSLYDLDR